MRAYLTEIYEDFSVTVSSHILPFTIVLIIFIMTIEEKKRKKPSTTESIVNVTKKKSLNDNETGISNIKKTSVSMMLYTDKYILKPGKTLKLNGTLKTKRKCRTTTRSITIHL